MNGVVWCAAGFLAVIAAYALIERLRAHARDWDTDR